MTNGHKTEIIAEWLFKTETMHSLAEKTCLSAEKENTPAAWAIRQAISISTKTAIRIS